MLYNYEATNTEGEKFNGSIEAATVDLAINSLQKRNLIVISIKPEAEAGSFLNVNLFERVQVRDIVIFSRQISTLFEAKVPILDSFRLLASESESPLLRRTLNEVVDDIHGGSSLSSAMSKHNNVFSKFFLSMVRSGEESGKLSEIFLYLADYLERSYELTTKAKRALIYPLFVISTFLVVTILMIIFVIPQLGEILGDAGQEVPFYTRLVLGFSESLRDFGIYILVAIGVGIIFLWRYVRSEAGEGFFDRLQISAPFIGPIFKKVYISRFTDNLETLISGGISMTRAIDITSDTVGNSVYSDILKDVSESVRGGGSISESLKRHKEVPPLVSQMIKVGEEGGRLSFVLKKLAGFYRREVDAAVETLISLIEPAMIIALAVMVGILLISVIGPIYNITSTI